ncbi:carbohydrate ABC transporter permease [Virgibacillus salexigens]|uniref:Lactose transport system permease protein LacF n=1 Tax=Virgibacillus massiliensis TaxID=1462526 RepID=A0A024Q5Z1_9BACI|nr:sugar ABC transporter permease [Virgibacillus massiliensis]CDQ37928.1 Lactose transport system permease protein LacF [Virgibacillus massiliensis]
MERPTMSIHRLDIGKKHAPLVLLAPAVLFFSLFIAYPIVSSLLLSFQISEAGQTSFVGFDNYIRLFQDPLFYEAMKNTLIIGVIQTPSVIILGLLTATLLNSGLIKLENFFRLTYFTPAVTSLVGASVIFLLLLNQENGLINFLLGLVGIDSIGWLNTPFWAKLSIILQGTWRWTGYNMVIILAGLQSISKDLYEAASIDGATKIRQFFSITIPQLRPVLLFCLIMSTIGSFQLFDEPYILTNGGPVNATTTITMYLYENGFQFFDFEYASAIAYVLVGFIALLTYVQFKLGGDKN